MLHKSWDQYIQSLTKDVYDEVCQYADIVLIEADGSRRKLLKLCRDDEPVIYDNVTEIVIIGLSALGKKQKMFAIVWN